MSDDYAFYREQTIRLIRQDGANQARLDGHDEEVKRLAQEMKDGLADVKTSLQGQVGSLRAELLTRMDTLETQRKNDMVAIEGAITENKQASEKLPRALSRVGWAIIAAVAAAAAAQIALSPQAARTAVQALEHISQ